MISNLSDHVQFADNSMHINDSIESSLDLERDEGILSSLLMLAQSSENALDNRSQSSSSDEQRSSDADERNAVNDQTLGSSDAIRPNGTHALVNGVTANAHPQNEKNQQLQRNTNGNTSKPDLRSTEQPPSHVTVHRRLSTANPSYGAGHNITLDDLRRYFHLPIAEVAKHLNTCTTALKKICRKLNINKWPYRQILSLTKSIQSIEMASLNDALDEELRSQYRKQIAVLRKTIAEVVHNPSKIVVSESLSKFADNLDDSDEGDAEASGGVGQSSSHNTLTTTTTSTATAFSTIPQSSATSAQPSSSSHAQEKAGTQVASLGGIYQVRGHTNGSSTSSGQLEGAENSTGVTSDAAPRVQESPASANANSSNKYESQSNVNQIIMAAAALISRHDMSPPFAHKPTKRKSGDGPGTAGVGGDEGGAQMTVAASKKLRFDAENEAFERIPALSALASPPGSILEIGGTSVKYTMSNENTRVRFEGPVKLTPLHRSHRIRANKKLIPFHESDIGKQVHIEFTPQFVLSLLHKTLIEKGALGGQGMNDGSMIGGQIEGYGDMSYLQGTVLPVAGIMPAPSEVNLNTYQIHAAYASVLQNRAQFGQQLPAGGMPILTFGAGSNASTVTNVVNGNVVTASSYPPVPNHSNSSPTPGYNASYAGIQGSMNGGQLYYQQR
eukprot:gene33755-40844_t